MPDLEGILARLEPVLGAAREPPVALDGGITNRNYRMALGEGMYVVRLPGKDTTLLGISREAERIACETAARLGVGPAVAAVDDESLVTAWVDAPPLDPDALSGRPGALESVAGAVRAFHDSGAVLPVRFWVPDLMEGYITPIRARGGVLPPDYGWALAMVKMIVGVLPAFAPHPCHNDLLAGNLMLTTEGAMIVDWEYAGMGHPMFDLGNLAVNNGLDAEAEGRLLSAYLGAEPTAAQHAVLRLMRMVSDAREAAWGVIQGVISELDFDFEGYARRHFARFREAFERESGECFRAATA